MSRKPVAPGQGDVVLLDAHPQDMGSPTGRWPSLVLSPQAYNEATGLMLCCPITSQVKGYPFEVPVAAAESVEGVALVDQLHSLDWAARRAERVGKTTEDVVDEALAKLRALLAPTQ